MRTIALLCASFTALLCGCGKGTQSASQSTPNAPVVDQKANDELKGTWQVVAITAGGKPVPQDRVQKINLQWIFNGENLTIRRPDRPDNTSSYSLDTTTHPKKLTINDSPPVRGVYSLDGNKLQVCMMVDESPNAGFPTALLSTASPKTDLLTLNRK